MSSDVTRPSAQNNPPPLLSPFSLDGRVAKGENGLNRRSLFCGVTESKLSYRGKSKTAMEIEQLKLIQRLFLYSNMT